MKIKIDTFQKAIEQPLVVKPEAHFVWNDIARKLVDKQDVTEEEFSLLEGSFIELQNQKNTGIVTQMITLRDKGYLNTKEMYLVANYFFTAEYVGPEGKGLKEIFFNQNMDSRSFKDHTQKISIPMHTRALIQNVYSNILERQRYES